MEKLRQNSQQKKRGEGLFVHVLNKNIDNIIEDINKILNISGEICVSEVGDEQFSTRKSKIAILLEGKLTAQFDCDCWSKIDAHGRRVATRLPSYSDRNEGWMIPKNSKIFGIAYKTDSKKLENEIRKAADYFKCSLISFSAIDKQN